MEAEDSHSQTQPYVKGYTVLDLSNQKSSLVEERKKHRFSALVDGICIGVGLTIVFLGLLTSMVRSEMVILGLVLIICGLVFISLGAAIEIYNLGKIHSREHPSPEL